MRRTLLVVGVGPSEWPGLRLDRRQSGNFEYAEATSLAKYRRYRSRLRFLQQEAGQVPLDLQEVVYHRFELGTSQSAHDGATVGSLG